MRWKDETQPKMKINEKNGVEYLTFPALDACEEIIHAFSTRKGGVSRGIPWNDESELYTWRSTGKRQ